MNIDGFEIERKFLIAMPEKAFLEISLSGAPSTEEGKTKSVGSPS